MHDQYDRSSNWAAWLIEHHGDSLLRLGGIENIRSWRALPSEIVQPKRLPDGLLEAQVEDQAESDLFLLEIATYPDARLLDQALRGTMLVYLARGVLPEVLTLILRPKGKSPRSAKVQSQRGWTSWQVRWRVVELWKLPAEQLLAANDVGLIPWVPLTKSAERPEFVLRECRERIEQSAAAAAERANLLAVTQVLAQLRFNDPRMLNLIGGSEVMIESPLIQAIAAERQHKDILKALAIRFGPIPLEISDPLRAIRDETKLDVLMEWALQCPDIQSFRAKLRN